MIWNNLKNPIVNRLHVTEPHLTQQIQWVGLERLKGEAAVTKSLLLFRRSGPEPGTRTRTRTRNQNQGPGTRTRAHSSVFCPGRGTCGWISSSDDTPPSVFSTGALLFFFFFTFFSFFFLVDFSPSEPPSPPSFFPPFFFFFFFLSSAMAAWSPFLCFCGVQSSLRQAGHRKINQIEGDKEEDNKKRKRRNRKVTK